MLAHNVGFSQQNPTLEDVNKKNWPISRFFKRFSDGRTNSHRIFDHHKCLKWKSNHKKVKFSNNFGKNLWCTFTQNAERQKYKFLFLKVIKSWVASKYMYS